MTDRRMPLTVWATALSAALVFLDHHDLCDCPQQQRTVAHRLAPFLRCWEEELARRTEADLDLVARKLAIHLFLAHTDLARGLHTPGASAAIGKKEWHRHAVSPGC